MMKKIVMLFAMLFVVGSANAAVAAPAAATGTGSVLMSIGGAVPYAVMFGTVYLMGQESTKPALACTSEPIRKVAWANNPNGYSFTVAGCDYQAKKDQLVEVK